MQVLPPAASLNGDMMVKLDSGRQYKVHHKLLRRASGIHDTDDLRYTLATEQPADIHVSGVTDKQLLSMLHALYACLDGSYFGSIAYGQDWADAQSGTDLWDVAAASHAMGCIRIIALVDRTLLHKAELVLPVTDALELCCQARQFGLKAMQYRHAIAVVKSMPTMGERDLVVAAEALESIMSNATVEVIGMFEQIERCNSWGLPHKSQSAMLSCAKKLKADLEAIILPDASKGDKLL